MLPNLSVFWVIVAVLVLTAVLDRLLLRPILDVIRRREQAIDSARDLARQSAAQAQSASAEFEQRTAAARADLYRQMDDMRRAALGRRAEIVEQTRTEAEAQVTAAVKRLDEDAAEARRRLETESETLGTAIAESIIAHYGRSAFLSRLSDPFWFQALGCVMGMDWHSSGITTAVLGALKRGLNPRAHELGLYVCGS